MSETSSWTSRFFSCFSRSSVKPQVTVLNDGFESRRERSVHYQQPHLIEPMTLRVYEDLPTTPIAPPPSIGQWSLFPRSSVASRASSRLSVFSLKKKTVKQDVIVAEPAPAEASSNDLPFRRRRREFRPLELSIYMDQNRLSDLPEFNRLSFTADGILKTPPKALLRPQSEQLLNSMKSEHSVAELQKPTSMYEAGGVCFVRPGSSYSVTQPSRPPSEYDALRSHPVSWAGVSALTVSTKCQKFDASIAILTPMEEEFPPEAKTVEVGDMILSLPSRIPLPDDVDDDVSSVETDLAAPAPVVHRMPAREVGHSRSFSAVTLRSYATGSNRAQKRINQWLTYRQHSKSVSTIASGSTGSSFAEHHRKRSQFYQLARPLRSSDHHSFDLSQEEDFARPQHSRTVTLESMASTVDTDVLSYDVAGRKSEDTLTTLCATEVLSRTGTIKSVSSPNMYKLMQQNMKELPTHPAMRGDIYIVDEEAPSMHDVHARLRDGPVGLAY